MALAIGLLERNDISCLLEIAFGIEAAFLEFAFGVQYGCKVELKFCSNKYGKIL